MTNAEVGRSNFKVNERSDGRSAPLAGVDPLDEIAERADMLARTPGEDINASIEQLEALRSSVHAQELAFMAEADRRESWRSDSASSLKQWVCWKLARTPREAAREIGVARCLGDLPHISVAYANGELSWDQVRLLVAFATPETDAMLAASAKDVPVSDLQRAAAFPPPSKERVEETHHFKALSMWWSDDKQELSFKGKLPAEHGAVFEKAIERIESRLPKLNGDSYGPLTMRQAEALVTLARAQIAADPDPDRATVVVHVDIDDLLNGGPAQLEGSTILGSTLSKMCCDARMQLVAHLPDGRPLGPGRMSRSLPRPLSRLVRKRDGNMCRFPGCTATHVLAEHHIQWWSDDGPTVVENIVLLCPFHHDLVHLEGWQVRLEGDLAIFTSPHGVQAQSGPPPLRDDIRRKIAPLFPSAAPPNRATDGVLPHRAPPARPLADHTPEMLHGGKGVRRE